MALTLAEAMIEQRPDKLTGSLITMFDQVSPVMKALPMTKIDGRYYDYERVISLPQVNWRPLNAPYTESTGVVNPGREYLKILGVEIKIDTSIINTSPRGTVDLMARQIKMGVQSMANEWDRAFFEGSEQNSAYEMVGLRARAAANQLLTINATTGSALTLAKINALVDAVPFSPRGGEKGNQEGRITKKLYMNRTLRSKFNSLIEAQTGSLRIETSRNEFGGMVERYRDCDIEVVETFGDGSSILGFDEDPGSGTATSSSIYCVAFGDELVHGIYNNGGDALIRVKQFGETQAMPQELTRIDGNYGMVIDHPRAAARLAGIINA
jgi:hypothetical protein